MPRRGLEHVPHILVGRAAEDRSARQASGLCDGRCSQKGIHGERGCTPQDRIGLVAGVPDDRVGKTPCDHLPANSFADTDVGPASPATPFAAETPSVSPTLANPMSTSSGSKSEIRFRIPDVWLCDARS